MAAVTPELGQAQRLVVKIGSALLVGPDGLRGDWLRGLFRQPPPGFYSRPAVYLSGDRMEIEHFCTVLFFDENRLCLRLAKGRFTVYGSGLRICTLTAARLTVQGQFLRTDFSDE